MYANYNRLKLLIKRIPEYGKIIIKRAKGVPFKILNFLYIFGKAECNKRFILTLNLTKINSIEKVKNIYVIFWLTTAVSIISEIYFRIIGATSLIFSYLGEFLSVKHRDKYLGKLEIFWNIGIIILPGKQLNLKLYN